MRVLFALLVAALATLSLSPGPAEARARRAAPVAAPVVVDVNAIRARGLTRQADIIQGTIAQELARSGPFRGRIYVRITSYSLNSFAGGSRGSRGIGTGGTSSDFLEGDFQMLGPRGEILAGRRMVVNAPATSGGAWYLPGDDDRRLQAVSRSFAGWVRRYSR